MCGRHGVVDDIHAVGCNLTPLKWNCYTVRFSAPSDSAADDADSGWNHAAWSDYIASVRDLGIYADADISGRTHLRLLLSVASTAKHPPFHSLVRASTRR
jgi:hypothetical protein